MSGKYDNPLPGNPFVPDYYGDEDGAAANAIMAVAYELRTIGLIQLSQAAQHTASYETLSELSDQVQARYGLGQQ